jgi:hypothetical protein
MGGNAGYDLTNLVTGYYGYTATERSGYSQLSPIPLAISNGLNGNGPQSFGCGGVGGGNGATGTATSGGQGGDGLAIIVTW